MAGLGGRAFDTGRANSMKGLHSLHYDYRTSFPKGGLYYFSIILYVFVAAIIKNGQPNAKIEIVMNNYPSKKNIYGNEIRIVRYLSREGSSRLVAS